jgi:hypothetical protein
MARGVSLLIALVVSSAFGLACRSKPSPRASTAPGAVSAPAPVRSAAVTTPSAAPSASSEPERISPLSSAAPLLPKAERNAAVELCCKMFDPYVTGCVRPQGICPHRMKGHCERAWKHGATLADIEPELRRLAPLEGYFVPPQCMASPTPPASAGN